MERYLFLILLCDALVCMGRYHYPFRLPDVTAKKNLSVMENNISSELTEAANRLLMLSHLRGYADCVCACVRARMCVIAVGDLEGVWVAGVMVEWMVGHLEKDGQMNKCRPLSSAAISDVPPSLFHLFTGLLICLSIWDVAVFLHFCVLKHNPI